MNFEQLEELNKKFASESYELQLDFIQLYKKWMKKSASLTVINTLNLPINLFLRIIEDSTLPVPEIIPDLPVIFMRMVYPFAKLKDQWGKVSNKEFARLYTVLYESQFDNMFASEKEKQAFKKWFEVENENKNL